MINNLELLQHLLKRGFLTEAEYEARRRQLVDQLTNTTFSSNSYCVPNQSELLPAYLAEPRALSPENDITLNNFSDILEKCEDSILSPYEHSIADTMEVDNSKVQTLLQTEQTSAPSSAESVIPCSPPSFPDMSLQEKQALRDTILTLHSGALQQVLSIVHEEEPYLLDKQTDEWAFDLNTLNPKTLWILKNYVEAVVRDSQGSTSPTSSTSTLTLTSSVSSPSFVSPTTMTTTISTSSISPNCATEAPNFAPNSFPSSPNISVSSPTTRNSLIFPKVTIESFSEASTSTTTTELSLNMDERRRKRKYLKTLPEPESNVDKIHNEIVKKTKYDCLKTNIIQPKNSVTPSMSSTECQQPFTVKITIIDTRQSKRNDGNYHCPACSNTFTNRSNLMKHLRIHTQEKPFVCGVCNKAFAYGNSLKEHMNTHERKAAYVCSYCQKTFSNGSNLNRHLRTHTGEKPYECHFCSRRFTQSNNLKAHMRKHMKS
jgi:uncharacterized CHY-type Zn-finger protein